MDKEAGELSHPEEPLVTTGAEQNSFSESIRSWPPCDEAHALLLPTYLTGKRARVC